jgi:hypothetical protein
MNEWAANVLIISHTIHTKTVTMYQIPQFSRGLSDTPNRRLTAAVTTSVATAETTIDTNKMIITEKKNLLCKAVMLYLPLGYVNEHPYFNRRIEVVIQIDHLLTPLREPTEVGEVVKQC